MTERSARFALPFILPGQAQKEIFHNEALATIDGLLHPAVEGSLAVPTADPGEGECWIVGAGATGAWQGHEDELALRTAGGWRFLEPILGMSIWDRDAGHARRWSGTAWSDGRIEAAALFVDGEQVVGPRAAEIAVPTGGAIVDAEAREAIETLIVTLKSHGLID